jgi:hypothetical protein
MKRRSTIHARTILEAKLRTDALGVRRALRELERSEPRLAGFLMESSTTILHRLWRACGSQAKASRAHAAMLAITLTCLDAVRRAARRKLIQGERHGRRAD